MKVRLLWLVLLVTACQPATELDRWGRPMDPAERKAVQDSLAAVPNALWVFPGSPYDSIAMYQAGAGADSFALVRSILELGSEAPGAIAWGALEPAQRADLYVGLYVKPARMEELAAAPVEPGWYFLFCRQGQALGCMGIDLTTGWVESLPSARFFVSQVGLERIRQLVNEKQAQKYIADHQ